MSNRILERLQGALGLLTENVVQWGGAPVAPAAPKVDGQSNAANVPEVGARLQGFNGSAAPGTWDRLRVGLTGITSTFLGFLNSVPYGKFNSDGVVLADGEGAPLQLDASGKLQVSVIPNTVGTQDNAWASVSTGVNGVSASIDCQYTPFVTVFGTTNGATTITLQVSQDNITFIDAASTVLAIAGGFEMSRTTGARYIRLKSSADVVASATIAAKD